MLSIKGLVFVLQTWTIPQFVIIYYSVETKNQLLFYFLIFLISFYLMFPIFIFDIL